MSAKSWVVTYDGLHLDKDGAWNEPSADTWLFESEECARQHAQAYLGMPMSCYGLRCYEMYPHKNPPRTRIERLEAEVQELKVSLKAAMKEIRKLRPIPERWR